MSATDAETKAPGATSSPAMSVSALPPETGTAAATGLGTAAAATLTEPAAPATAAPAAALPDSGAALSAATPAAPSSASLAHPAASVALPSTPAVVAPPAVAVLPAPSEPVKYYAYHTRRKPKQAKRTPSAATAAAAKRRAFLASFDEESSSSFSSGSSSSDSDDDSDSDSEEESEATRARRALKAVQKAATGAQQPQKSGAAAAASSAVSRSAGLPAAPASKPLAGRPPAQLPRTSTPPAAAAVGAAASLYPGKGGISSSEASRSSRLKVFRLFEPVLNATLAPLVERALFQKHGGVNASYNAHTRDLVQSLRLLQGASKPSKLLHDVLAGTVTPAQLVQMSSADLANDELRQQREQHQAQRLRDLQKPTDEAPSMLAKVTAADRHSDERASKVLDSFITGQSSTPRAVAAAAAATVSSVSSTPSAAQAPKFVSVSSEFLSSESLAASDQVVSALQLQRRASLDAQSHALSDDDSDDEEDDEPLIVDTPSKPAVASSAAGAAAQTTLKRKLSSEPSPRSANAATATQAAIAANKRQKAIEGTPSTSRGIAAPIAVASGRPPSASATTASVSSPMRDDAEQKAVIEPEPFRLHPTDPISLPVFDAMDADKNAEPAAYSGLLKVNLPRRGEMPIALHELPTRADLLPAGVCSASESSSLRSTRHRWSHILLDELVAHHKMRVTEIERYIRFKAAAHLQPSHSGAKPSPSIQASSRYYPLSFVLRSTEPLLEPLLHDVSTFHRANKLALALDFESSSIPAEHQCVLWLMPPGSLEYLSSSVATEVLGWRARPPQESWFGVLWIKAFVLRAMKKSVENDKRKQENEMDVPSDGEQEQEQTRTLSPQPLFGAETTAAAAAAAPPPAPVIAPAETVTPNVRLIQDETKLALTTDYLNSLLRKIGSSSSSAAASTSGAAPTASFAAAPASAPAAFSSSSGSAAASPGGMASIMSNIRTNAVQQFTQMRAAGMDTTMQAAATPPVQQQPQTYNGFQQPSALLPTPYASAPSAWTVPQQPTPYAPFHQQQYASSPAMLPPVAGVPSGWQQPPPPPPPPPPAFSHMQAPAASTTYVPPSAWQVAPPPPVARSNVHPARAHLVPPQTNPPRW